MGAINFLPLVLSFVVLYLFDSSLAHHFNNSADYFEAPTLPEMTPRIAGGVPAQKNEFPWVVFVAARINNEIRACGGALIRLDAVLTAAHCVIGASPSDITIIAGKHILDQAEPSEQVGVGKRVKWHENFNEDFLNRTINDIAVIKLEQSLQESPSVQTIRLPGSTRNNFNINLEQITIAGWGITRSNSPPSSTLRKITLPVVPKLLCVYRFLWFVRDDRTQICAGKWRQGICPGDSGSPAICSSAPGEVCGIASYTVPNCGAQSFHPGVYTRVAPYISWINEALKD